MDTFIKIFTVVAVWLLMIGLLMYGILLLMHIFNQIFNQKWASSIVGKWKDHSYELPMSGIAAFGIVSLLRSQVEGPLEFKAFSLEFTGPAGPVTLWVVVYLSIVLSLKILKK